MPHVGLLLNKPTLTFDNGEFGSKGWRLSFKSELANAWHQQVELTTDDKFEDLDGTVAFEDADGSEAYKGHGKGSLTFWKGRDDPIDGRPPAYLATIRMPSTDLARLTQTIIDGLPLRSVNIDVPIEYGWQPDGSGKKWDNAANPAVAIEGYRLFFGEAEEEEVLPDPPETAIDHTPKILAELRNVGRTLNYLLYAVIAGAVLIAWSH
jgi:hypothetical protein